MRNPQCMKFYEHMKGDQDGKFLRANMLLLLTVTVLLLRHIQSSVF